MPLSPEQQALNDRHWELRRQYEERFGEGEGICVWYPWDAKDFIAAYEKRLREDKPFDYDDPKWPWNQGDPLPEDAIL